MNFFLLFFIQKKRLQNKERKTPYKKRKDGPKRPSFEFRHLGKEKLLAQVHD